jgi:hypothetical protein
MKTLIFLCLMIATLGYAHKSESSAVQSPEVKSANQNRAADEDDIRATVFRYQFEHNASGFQNARVYFLAVGKDQDPGDAFMAGFRDHKPPVKKVSQSKSHTGFRDKYKPTEESGPIFRVTKIKWQDETVSRPGVILLP